MTKKQITNNEYQMTNNKQLITNKKSEIRYDKLTANK